ncbi:DUF3592 domain-containing protein [Streptomyces sp. NPDC021080]|uniref:DUF3592 domain-containing protein n=1 Tax=Streptomyces sp. NPDC021080 TaxID=3365110 RepID=UPI00378E9F4D
MILIAVVFAVFLSAIVITPVVAGVVAVRKVRRRTRAQRYGLRTEGRCIRVETVRRSGGGYATSTRRYFLFEYVTHDGRQVRFEDAAPNTTVPGDLLAVSYLPDDPEGATVALPGDRTAQRELGCLLAFLGVALMIALIIAAVGIGVISLFASGA